MFPVMMMPQFRSLHWPALTRQWRGIVAVGSFVALNIVLNNLSLVSHQRSALASLHPLQSICVHHYTARAA